MIGDPLDVIEVERGHYYRVEAILVPSPYSQIPIGKSEGVVQYRGTVVRLDNGGFTMVEVRCP